MCRECIEIDERMAEERLKERKVGMLSIIYEDIKVDTWLTDEQAIAILKILGKEPKSPFWSHGGTPDEPECPCHGECSCHWGGFDHTGVCKQPCSRCDQ